MFNVNKLWQWATVITPSQIFCRVTATKGAHLFASRDAKSWYAIHCRLEILSSNFVGVAQGSTGYGCMSQAFQVPITESKSFGWPVGTVHLQDSCGSCTDLFKDFGL